MRRKGQYVDSGGNAYASAQMQHMPAQRMEVKSDQFQGQLEAFTPERDQPYQTPKSDGQWRDEFLRKESLVRLQQYQQAVMDYYPRTVNNPHGYGSIAAVGDAHRGYNSDNFDSYGERSRFLGGARDQGFEPKGSYQGGVHVILVHDITEFD
ncbi:Detected protein of unknown function [Hibiscus syriacus]|uniref:Uncharacterized protein n=1 Tax=Hibiscus syriacus TaxID=106335 RepID=A0A6A2YSZ5_HIBSY|nr:Detected protein of unknown function [Hibiscus syriacus]